MPDNLTQKFKEDLKARARSITTTTPMAQSGSVTTGQSLWETAGTQQQPNWMTEALEGEGSVARTAGLALWGFLETGTLGLAGLSI